jgi:hypothetical protein
MIRPARIATAIVIAAAPIPALAQGGGAPPKVLGRTGTMYDGNNARLQLPSEPNAWYQNRWAGYEPNRASAGAGAAAATGAGTAGTSLGTTKTGGEH